MKVSVITLTYNSELTIEDTVNSVQSQTYPNIEHVIIDNVSSDSTLKLIKSLYSGKENILKVKSEKDKGISDGFNRGIEAASGEILVFLNSDDVYQEKDLIEKVVKAFEDPEVMFVHGDMFFEDLEFGSNRRRPLFCSLTYGMPFNHPTMFIRRSLYDKIGKFDLSYRYAMDFHLVCRMYDLSGACKYKGVYLEEPCFVTMRAGGVSDIQEINSIDDVERALRETGHYTFKAGYFLFLRRMRIRLKKLLSLIGAEGLIKLWRRFKWS